MVQHQTSFHVALMSMFCSFLFRFHFFYFIFIKVNILQLYQLHDSYSTFTQYFSVH